MRPLLCALSLSLLAACQSANMYNANSPQYNVGMGAPQKGPPRSYIQGQIGLTEVSKIDAQLSPEFGSIADDGAATFPLLGAAYQEVLGGDRLRFGLEGGFSAGWQGDTGTVVLGNGTVLVVSDNDIFLFDMFIGLFGELPLGQRARLYGGAGPLLQYGKIDLDYINPMDELVSLGDSGWGGGYYTRLGVEFEVRPGTLLGFGARWIDSEVNVGGGFDKLAFEGIQYALTVSTSH